MIDAATTSPQSVRWTAQDVVDFEFYLQRDETARRVDGGEEPLCKRDRALYLNELGGRGEQTVDSSEQRRRIFRGWLETQRRQEAHPELSAGQVAGSLLQHLTLLMVVGGSLLGLCAILGAFYYGVGSGHLLGDQAPAPVNVFFFFAVCVLPQFAFALGAGLFLFGGISGSSCSSLYAALGALLRPLIRWLGLRGAEAIGAEQRLRIGSIIGILTGRASLHHRILKWLLPIRLQWFGFAYGASLLGAMLFMIAFSDRSCGWYSSKWLTPERVHTFAKVLAVPWSAVAPEGVGYPTLDQVKGSQVRLSAGARQLNDSDLKSWLGFLLWCVAVYGVLPRGAVLLASHWAFHRALRRLDFQDLRCDRLWGRLTTELAQWTTSPEAQPASQSVANIAAPFVSELAANEVLPAGSCVILTPPDLLAALDQRRLAELLKAKFGWQPARFEIGGGSAAQDRESLAQLGATRWQDGRPCIVIVQRGYMPPIITVLRFIADCRQTAGERARVVVALIGKPAGGVLLTPPRQGDLAIWLQKVNALGDPNVAVERLV